VKVSASEDSFESRQIKIVFAFELFVSELEIVPDLPCFLEMIGDKQ
jgi:hypothetical protein